MRPRHGVAHSQSLVLVDIRGLSLPNVWAFQCGHCDTSDPLIVDLTETEGELEHVSALRERLVLTGLADARDSVLSPAQVIPKVRSLD